MKEQTARRARLITHAIALGWKKRLNGTDVVDVPGHDPKKVRWDYLFRGLYLGHVDDRGHGTFYTDLALTDKVGLIELKEPELQILALLAMREYPEIIQEW